MAKKTKKATTVAEQISKMINRGVVIADTKKAEEYLLDIGYYRLGFYLHPFEVTYPELGKKRRHRVNTNTRIEDAVALYYFDFDLRNILNRYLSRIEIAIRTTMIYELSNKYNNNPVWFVDPAVVSTSFVTDFPNKVYKTIKDKEVIKRHHRRYPTDVYAPAWKTMEFMVFGNLTTLYNCLLLNDDRRLVSQRYGVAQTNVFFDYIEAVRLVRNACAHGNVLFDFNLYTSVNNGPAGRFIGATRHNLGVALEVIKFLLKTVSSNRCDELERDLIKAAQTLYKKCPSLEPLIESKTGIKVPKTVKKTKLPDKIQRKIRKIHKKLARMLAKANKNT